MARRVLQDLAAIESKLRSSKDQGLNLLKAAVTKNRSLLLSQVYIYHAWVRKLEVSDLKKKKKKNSKILVILWSCSRANFGPLEVLKYFFSSISLFLWLNRGFFKKAQGAQKEMSKINIE